MTGNLCRCGAYPKIERAILRAAGERMTARFVKTQKEMEGRYEDVWALVDEADDVENWSPEARALARRAPGAAPRREAARDAGACATRSTSVSRACSTRPCSARPSRTGACDRSTSTPPGRRTVSGP